MDQGDLYMCYHGFCLPKLAYTAASLKHFESFQVQDDDIFVITYPKSGEFTRNLLLLLLFDWKEIKF